jgi:hypothetical protein
MADKGDQLGLTKAICDAILHFQQNSEEDIMEITVSRVSGRPREPRDAMVKLGQESFKVQIRAVQRYSE